MNIQILLKKKRIRIMYREVFPSRLKAAREKNGFTQLEVSKKLNIKQQSISQYETGLVEPDLRMLATFANFYGVTVDWLLGRGSINFQPKYKEIPLNVIYNSAIQFPQKIKAERLKKNISQYKLAKETKISRSTLSLYELGITQPNLERLAKIATYYKVSIDSLLGI
jgi:transcriptional regulator with XRE-family HTH domain